MVIKHLYNDNLRKLPNEYGDVSVMKGAGQPAHPRSLISDFLVRCLGSIISLDFIAELSSP